MPSFPDLHGLLPGLRAVVDDDANDGAFCRALYAATRDDLRRLPLPQAQIDGLIALQWQVHEAGRRQRFPHARVLILEHAHRRAGRVVLDAGGQVWRLVDLAILPGLRRRGLARALLAALQRRAAENGAAIALSVAATNTAALRLYLNVGFCVADGDALHDMLREMLWQPA